MKPCAIIFDRPYNTYFVGQTVNGRVEFTLKKQKKIRAVLLRVKGEANVSWKGKEPIDVNEDGKETKIQPVTYQNEDEYLKMEYYCLRNRENEDTTLSTGKHVYPFSFILPINLPSSFEGKYGYIRYTIKVILERPFKDKRETKTAFTVISPHNLNMESGLMEQVKVCGDRAFGWMCCTTEPLTYVMVIPKSGFVSGEEIPILIEVDNKSRVMVSNITLKLQQITSYHSKIPSETTKEEVLVLEKLKLGSLSSRKSLIWRQSIVVPPLPPSNLSNCCMIVLEYKLLLEISVPSFCKNVISTIPIKIGTVPTANIIMNSKPSAPPPDYQTAVGRVNNNNIVPEIEASTLSTSKFHSTKSIEDREDNECTMYCDNSKGFAPYYLVYNLNKR